MKILWDKMSETMTDFNAMIGEMVNEPCNDVRLKRAIKKMYDVWIKIINQRNELDKQIEPIPALSVKMPFESNEFFEMWKTYKEYLTEDYYITIGTRRESIVLNRLKRLSGANEQRAIDMLELFIANGYKSMFIPSEKQLKGEEPAKAEEQNQHFDINKKTSM